MKETDFFCYGCQRRKSLKLKSVRPGKASCTTCWAPTAKREAMGLPKGPYSKHEQNN